MAQKNEFAVGLARLRAKKLTQEERSAIAAMGAAAVNAQRTPEERSEAARRAVAARWAKKGKVTK